MQKIEEKNSDVLLFLNAKLIKDYSKLGKGKNVSKEKEEVLKTLEYGTEENKYLLDAGLGVFVLPFAIGASSFVLGMVSLVPIADQTITSSVTQGALEIGQFGEKAMMFGMDVMGKSLPLIAVPASITALSLSVKLYQMLKEEKSKKNKANYAMINFIDDILTNKDDDTLVFAKKVFKRVDLSTISPKNNLKLIKNLAYHRALLKQYELGNISQEEVDDAYDNIIVLLEQLRDEKHSKNDLQKNRFVSLLIDDYHKRKYEEYILHGYNTK